MPGFWPRESNPSGAAWSITTSRLRQTIIWSDDSLAQSASSRSGVSLAQSASSHNSDCAARAGFPEPQSRDINISPDFITTFLIETGSRNTQANPKQNMAVMASDGPSPHSTYNLLKKLKRHIIFLILHNFFFEIKRHVSVLYEMYFTYTTYSCYWIIYLIYVTQKTIYMLL